MRRRKSGTPAGRMRVHGRPIDHQKNQTSTSVAAIMHQQTPQKKKHACVIDGIIECFVYRLERQESVSPSTGLFTWAEHEQTLHICLWDIYLLSTSFSITRRDCFAVFYLWCTLLCSPFLPSAHDFAFALHVNRTRICKPKSEDQKVFSARPDVCLLGPHPSFELSRCPKWTKGSRDTNQGSFRANQKSSVTVTDAVTFFGGFFGVWMSYGCHFLALQLLNSKPLSPAHTPCFLHWIYQPGCMYYLKEARYCEDCKISPQHEPAPLSPSPNVDPATVIVSLTLGLFLK